MTDEVRIQPNLEFVRAIRDSGGDTVKQCMQCANCSVACELSPEEKPFPRKEMILAQWGQEEALVTDPDIWLCFGCTDCSIECPRGARPGDVLGAVRMLTIRRFAPLGFIQKLLSSPKYLPILIAVPIVIWGLIYLLAANPAGKSSYFDGIFPPGVLEPVLGAMTVLGSLFLFIGGLRYWNALVKKHPRPDGKGMGFVPAAIAGIKDIVSHKKFKSCESGESRSLGHMLMLYGFALIFIGGSIVGIGFMFHLIELPLAFTNPFKIMLNVGAVGLLAGSFLLLKYRLTRPERQTKGSWYDWFLLYSLFGTALTGILVELTRAADLREIAFGTYFVHLVFVFCLLGYAPWGKIAHVVYRSVALIHAHHTGR